MRRPQRWTLSGGRVPAGLPWRGRNGRKKKNSRSHEGSGIWEKMRRSKKKKNKTEREKRRKQESKTNRLIPAKTSASLNRQDRREKFEVVVLRRDPDRFRIEHNRLVTGGIVLEV